MLLHKVPVKTLTLPVATVYDLTLDHYGLDRGLDDANCARDLRRRAHLFPRLGGTDLRRAAQPD
nr:nitrate reductase subunit alpha [Candidatus Pantoea persica]